MAGLTSEGFTPSTLEEIQTRIKSRLENYNAGFDFTPESPDGQLIDIFSIELAQVWDELGLVYGSFDPSEAVGQGLINLGLITGIPFGVATRSSANIDLIGTAGTVVPALSEVSDAEGNLFQTEYDAAIPATVPVIAQQAGPIPVPVGALVNIETSIAGWDSIDQTSAGSEGTTPQSETAYRNLRSRTVQRNHTGVAEAMKARLFELGVEQATVQNNSSGAPLPDGTPAQHVHVTVGELDNTTDLEIAQVILDTKGLGVPTHGSTTVLIEDSQGVEQPIKFSKASAVYVFMDINITFLDEDIAGAEEAIKDDLVTEINSYLTGEDVIWSRLFGIITNHGKAQINSLEIGKSLGTLAPSNIVIEADEFTSTDLGSIAITVV